jgi:hypothetical protein
MWPKILRVLVIGLLLGLLAPGVQADEKSKEVALLFKDLSRQLGTVQPGDQGSKANNAAWEDTAAFLHQRFGSGEEKPLSSQAARAKGASTWSTSLMRGRHSREIQATWNRDQRKLEVTVAGNAQGAGMGQQKEPVGGYFIRMQADVVEDRDDKGNPILRARLPAKGAVESFAVGCDEKEQLDLSSTWTDNWGRVWVIRHTPLKCADPQASISLERTNSRGFKVVHKGEIRNWQIKVQHNIVHPNAIVNPRPYWLRQVIASGAKGRGSWTLSLVPRRQEDGTISLEGTYTGFNVTWNPGNKTVSQVFPSYQAPISLTRKISKGKFRIVRIEKDTWKWESRLSGLQNDIAQLERNLKWYQERLNNANASFENLKGQKQPLEEKMAGTIKAIAALESSLKASQQLPKKISEKLQRLLDTKTTLERLIEEKVDEIIELNEKRPPNWWEIIARKEKIRKDYQQQLQRVDNLIKEEYARIGFDPANKQRDVQRQLGKLWDKYWDIRREQAKLDVNLRLAARSIDYYRKNINERVVKLTDLRQKLKELDARDTPFVDKVMVYDANGKEIGRWEAWAPFEVIQCFNEKGERLRKDLNELEPLKKKSAEHFRQAALESSQALDQVARVIKNSGYIQLCIEFLDYGYEVGKGFSQGGPLGALGGAVFKFAAVNTTNFLLGEGIIFESNPQELEAKVKEKYGFKPNLFNEINMDLVQSSGDSVIVEEVGFKLVRIKFDQHITARVQEFLIHRTADQLIRGLEAKNINMPLEVLEKQIVKLKMYDEYLKGLKGSGQFQLNNFAKDMTIAFVKEVVKRGAKEAARVWEDQAWVNYFQKDLLARMYFAKKQTASVAYWNAYDQYMYWRLARDKLVRGYDPKSGFKEIKSEILEEGKTYSIAVEFRDPKGIREKVWLGIREARLNGAPDNHKFGIQAKNLKPHNAKGDIVLKIEVQ